jgi:hypothetical protein
VYAEPEAVDIVRGVFDVFVAIKVHRAGAGVRNKPVGAARIFKRLPANLELR